jgi:hypothetical protein
MAHGLTTWSPWRLAAGAASLEVTMDPAAHGPTAIGPWTRTVRLRTASGAELQFTLKATVIP